MNCQICGTNNKKKPCSHYNLSLDDLKKDDWVFIKREPRNEFEKEVIYRKIRGINESKVWCDDNIEYLKSQIIEIE